MAKHRVDIDEAALAAARAALGTRTISDTVNEALARAPRGAVGGEGGDTDLEIGHPARSAEEWDRALDGLEALELIETSAEHFHRTRQVQRMLAVRHQRGRKVPDLLVASAAEVHDLTVLHYDTDFDRIAAVTGQRVEWVVPAGSVD